MAARYRKVSVRLRSDAKFRNLSPPQPNAQSLFVYLLTCKHTTAIPGLVQAGSATMADDLGWGVKPFKERFAELSRNGMAKADWDAKLVWLPNAIRHNAPANPNVVKGWGMWWDELPDSNLKVEAYRVLAAAVKPLSERFAEAFHKACGNGPPNGIGNQEQEQEQEQNQEQEQEKIPELAGELFSGALSEPPPLGRTGVPKKQQAMDLVVQRIYGRWRNHHQRAPETLRYNSTEWVKIRDRVLEKHGESTIGDAIDGFHQSSFHMGREPKTNGAKHLGIATILRDASQITAGLGFLEGNDGPQLSAQNQRNLAAAQRAEARQRQGSDNDQP